MFLLTRRRWAVWRMHSILPGTATEAYWWSVAEIPSQTGGKLCPDAKTGESPLLGIVLNRVDRTVVPVRIITGIIAVDTIMKMGTDMVDLGMAVGPHMKSCRPAEENKMKSKRMVRIAGLALVSLCNSSDGNAGFAAQWHPSRTQQEVEVVQDQVTASDGAVITIHTAPAVEQGTVPKAEEVLQVESATQALIQITPVSSALAANAAVVAANPQATSEQLADVATGSGLTFAANGQLSALYPAGPLRRSPHSS